MGHIPVLSDQQMVSFRRVLSENQKIDLTVSPEAAQRRLPTYETEEAEYDGNFPISLASVALTGGTTGTIVVIGGGYVSRGNGSFVISGGTIQLFAGTSTSGFVCLCENGRNGYAYRIVGTPSGSAFPLGYLTVSQDNQFSTRCYKVFSAHFTDYVGGFQLYPLLVSGTFYVDITGGFIQKADGGTVVDATGGTIAAQTGFVCVSVLGGSIASYSAGHIGTSLPAGAVPIGYVDANSQTIAAYGMPIVYSLNIGIATLPKGPHTPFALSFPGGTATPRLVKIAAGFASRNGDVVYVPGGSVTVSNSSGYLMLRAPFDDSNGWGNFEYVVVQGSSITDADYPLGYVTVSSGSVTAVESFCPTMAIFIKTGTCD